VRYRGRVGWARKKLPPRYRKPCLRYSPTLPREGVWVKSHGHFAGIEIYAIDGRKMPLPALSAENPLRIDTRAWPAGLYMVRATLQNGRVLMQKVIKNRQK